MTPNDTFSFDCALSEGYGPDGVMMDSLRPSSIKDMPYAIDEGYLSNCCWFITLLMSTPPISEGAHELDVDFGLEFGPSDGANPVMIVFLDITLGKTFMFEKDLNRNPKLVPSSSTV